MSRERSEHGRENDPRFLKRVDKARANLRAKQGIPFEDIVAEDDRRTNEPSPARRKRRG